MDRTLRTQGVKDGPVTVALAGGLGNQMFQYAMGRSVAIRNGANLILDTAYVDADPQRSFALTDFRIKAEVVASPARHPLQERVNRFLKRRFRRKGVERCFEFDARLADVRPPVRLEGFFQSPLYFKDFEPEIREDFSLATELTGVSQGLLGKIHNSSCSVSVHVRRGDYVSNPTANAYHGTCSVEWYSAARKLIQDRLPDAEFFVFSDDLRWAKANLTEFRNATFVDDALDRPPAHEQFLMAQCKHHIIANSSFSWWAAWLNPSMEKLVVAPDRWFAAALRTKDLIPNDWIRL